jgi:two-component system phosphate regulon response regulator OmpR
MTDAAHSEKAHILVVDDDPRVRTMLSRYFEEEGFRVSLAESGAAMRDRMGSSPADLVLLDLVLPGEDGIALARELRSQSDVGIIMLTGRSDIVDRVVGLEVGADDYISKPFHLREVLARVKTVLRRTQPAARTPTSSERKEPIFTFDGWRLDVDRRQLTAPNGSDVPLTTGEFNLLCILLHHPGRVLDRDQLMDLTRGREWEAFDRTIDAQVARLRKKIEHDPKNPTIIKSVRGAGYVLTAKVTLN